MSGLPIIISITLITLNSWHVLTQWFVNKPNEIFTGISHYYADYFLYVSQIIQGANGGVLFAHHLYTNESLKPTWIYWFYVVLGRLGFLANPFVLYNASIVILSGIALFLIWKIITKIFPQTSNIAMVAFLFVTTASNFPHMTSFLSVPTSLVGDFWFSPTPALNRLGGVPHQIFQTILLLLLILLYSRRSEIKKDNPQSTNYLSFVIYHLPFAILALLLGSGSPMQMLILLMATTVYTLIFTKKYSDLLIAIPAFIGAWLTTKEFSLQPILILAKAWEDAQKVSITPWQFFIALGPIGFFIPFGVRSYMKTLTPLKTIILSYGSLSLIAFFSPLPALLHTSPTRWISPASFILLPILAAEGFKTIAAYLHKRQSKNVLMSIIPSILLVAYITLTMLSLYVQVQSRSVSFINDPTIKLLNHVPMSYIEGLQAIQRTPVHGVVLTDPAIPIDIVVPIFTGKTSFTGQSIHTLYPQTKEQLRQKFFSEKMTEQEAHQFFSDHSIRYIITTSGKKQFPQYQSLQKVFENTVLTIYSVL